MSRQRATMQQKTGRQMEKDWKFTYAKADKMKSKKGKKGGKSKGY